MPTTSSDREPLPAGSQRFAPRLHGVIVATSLGLGLFLTACGDSLGPPDLGISVVPLRTEYAPGDTIRIRIENHRSGSIGVSPCHAILERRSRSAWLAVPQSGHSCVEIIRGFTAPGGNLTGPAGVIPITAPAGTYRARLFNVILEQGGDPHTVFSAPFTVVLQ